MKKLVLSLVLLVATTANAQTKKAPDASNLVYLGTVTGPNSLQIPGDPSYGAGLAVRNINGLLKIYIGSFKPTQIIEGDVPSSLTGKLLNLHSIGTLPCEWSTLNGLFWDEVDQTLDATCHKDYDGDIPINPTFSKGHIVNGKLVSDGQWAFNISDKMTDGGVTAVPLNIFGCRLLVGFGAYRSVVANGPASEGLALSCFSPPTTSAVIQAKTIISFPFTTTGPAVQERQHRSPDYNMMVAYEMAYKANPPIGYTVFGDWCLQCGVWVETEHLSGFVSVWQHAIGRIQYLNGGLVADGWRYDLVTWSPEAIKNKSPVPNTDVPFSMPGIAQPQPAGSSVPHHVITGVTYEPISHLLFIGVQHGVGTDTSTSATAILIYKVVDPLILYTVTRVTTVTETQDVSAINSDEAIKKSVGGTWITSSTTSTSTASPK